MKKVLQLTVHLFPNVGGVETHLKDLKNSLIKRGWEVFFLAYQPLSTKVEWKIIEREKNLFILRIPWIRGFFEKLIHNPFLEFIYLVPGLFIVAPFIIFIYSPDFLHAHGLSAAVAAVIWGKIFKIKTIISLHSLYAFPKKGLYHDFVKLLFKNADFILSLSRKSNEEVKAMGIGSGKKGVFTYWVDLDNFKRVADAKNKLKWEGKFIVLFVGRLVPGKGIEELLESSKLWDKNIKLVIIGSGPMHDQITQFAMSRRSLNFLGKIDQNSLSNYYSAADFVIVPSTSEEGFGRVIIESLACETPVIASKRGAITEAMDETVGKFIDATPEGIEGAVKYFYNNPRKLLNLAKKGRKFAELRYSEANVKTIIKTYSK